MADDGADTGVGGVLARIAAWESAGLVPADLAARLRAFESGDGSLVGAPPPVRVPALRTIGSRRAIVAEAVGYVGAAFAIGALILLLVDVWGGLTPVARIAVAALATLLLLGAGAGVRTVALPALQRLTSVLWTGSVGTFGWTVGLVGSQVLDLSGTRLGQWVTAATLAWSLPLYLLRRRLLLQAALLGSVLGALTSTLLVLTPLEPEPVWAGLGVVGVGLAWVLLGTGGWLAPAVVAEVLGSAVVLVGSQIMSADPTYGLRWLGLTVGIAFAIALVIVAVRTDTRHPLVLGAGGLFVLTPQLVFELFEDTIGVPLTLLVIGLLLVVLAVGLARARRDMAGHHPTPGGEG